MARFTVDDVKGAASAALLCAGGVFAVEVLEDDEERNAIAELVISGVGTARILEMLKGWGITPGVKRTALGMHFAGSCSCPDGTALKGIR